MIINLTQHPATPEQLADGVIDFEPGGRAALWRLLTFDGPPSARDVAVRARAIAQLAEIAFDARDDALDAASVSLGRSEDVEARVASEIAILATHDRKRSAMIGGASFLMAPLDRALREAGIEPLYAFSTRESVEEQAADGSVREIAVFRHRGFVVASEDAR